MTADQQPGASGLVGERRTSVTDNPLASRFELRVDGELAGYAQYRDVHAGRAFEHTVIAAEYEGQGLASQLIRYSLDEAVTAYRRVLPFCPFVRSYVQRHPAYIELVDEPERFGLTAPTSS